MRDCVCFVYGKFGGTMQPVGTAFFVAIPVGANQTAIVVTDLHVIADIEEKSDDKTAVLRVNTRDGESVLISIPPAAWTKPDQSIEIMDLCFCPMPIPWNHPNIDYKMLTREQAATAEIMEAEELGVGNEVAFAGLFVNHYGRRRNEPIVRFGNIAKMPGEPVRTRHGDIEAYLVESRSVGGLSGSPVFVDVGLVRGREENRIRRRTGDSPAMYLMGVMQGHWAAPIEIPRVNPKEETANLETADAANTQPPQLDSIDITSEYVNMGIAVVTPIDKLFQLIEQSAFRRSLDEAAKSMTESLSEGSAAVLRSE